MKDIEALLGIFERENMRARIFSNKGEALRWIISEVPAGCSVAFAGSETIRQIGAREYFLAHGDAFNVIDPYEPGISADEAFERRRQAMLADVLLTSSNAITMDGQIVNMDSQGNRVAGICFGPRKVIIAVGRNKIVKDLAGARRRISTVAAPMNSKRLNRGNPCESSGRCEGCGLPSRICRIFTIIDGQTVKGRIEIAIIDEDLGF